MALEPETLPLEIDVQSVRRLLDSTEDFLLVDCREPAEVALVHLETAKHIPMGEIPARLPELEAYRNRRIVVFCHHGGRSLQVTHWMRGQAFPKVQNMAGGIDTWAIEVDPALPRY